MPYQRRLRKVGNSFVLAVPEAIRNHLGLSRETDLHWHRHGPKEALVTLHSRRSGGKPAAGDAAALLDVAHAEIERLRVKLQARPAAVYREGYAAGYSAGSKLGINLAPMIDALRRDVEMLTDRVEERAAASRVAGRAPAQLLRRRRKREAAPAADRIEAGAVEGGERDALDTLRG